MNWVCEFSKPMDWRSNTGKPRMYCIWSSHIFVLCSRYFGAPFLFPWPISVFSCWAFRFTFRWQGLNSSRYGITLLSVLGLSHALESLGESITTALKKPQGKCQPLTNVGTIPHPHLPQIQSFEKNSHFPEVLATLRPCALSGDLNNTPLCWLPLLLFQSPCLLELHP